MISTPCHATIHLEAAAHHLWEQALCRIGQTHRFGIICYSAKFLGCYLYVVVATDKARGLDKH